MLLKWQIYAIKCYLLLYVDEERVMNFSLGKNWEKYVSERVDSGHFNNASEVVRDALRRQQEYLIKLEDRKSVV